MMRILATITVAAAAAGVFSIGCVATGGSNGKSILEQPGRSDAIIHISGLG